MAAGFEHSIANMYFVPLGLFIAAFVAARGLEVQLLSRGGFLRRNLLPMRIGNVIGGPLLVVAVYWFGSLRPWREW